MQRLAFVDHSFHKKTRSGDFLRRMLSEAYEIDDFWDSSWSGGPGVDVSLLRDYDCVFYFQVLSPIEELKKIPGRIFWAPMYDGQRLDVGYWARLSLTHLRIIAFSRRIAIHCSRFQIDYLALSYYLEPQRRRAAWFSPEHTLFFWYRGSVKFADFKHLIDPEKITRFIYLEVPDPNYRTEEISEEDISRYKITFIRRDFIPHQEYLELLRGCNIFIAPRRQEGIGMSVLEAISYGIPVIAYDDATMNQYIVSDYNGILYDASTRHIDLDRVKMLRGNAFSSAARGHTNWTSEKSNLIPFLAQPKRRHMSVGKGFRLALVVVHRLWCKAVTRAMDV